MSKRLPRKTKPCDNCGEPVTRKEGSFAEHAYCSKECYWASDQRAELGRELNRKAYPRGSVRLICDRCGEEFVRQTNILRKGSRKTFCTLACYHAHRHEGAGRLNRDGYVILYVGKGLPGVPKSGVMLEHRWVMQQALGRPLVDKENVHHRNGVRSDNRLENLELWTRAQPLGQRVSDKIAWAKEFLALYEDTPMF